MNPSVYLESSIVSYLTARPSRDLIVAANQEVTREWWNGSRAMFDLYVSELVLREISAGDTIAASERRQALTGIPILQLRDEVLILARAFIERIPIPPTAADDAFHIALAATYGMDYLLTWNCAHIANAQIQKKVAHVCAEMGYEPPTICTPLELTGGDA